MEEGRRFHGQGGKEKYLIQVVIQGMVQGMARYGLRYGLCKIKLTMWNTWRLAFSDFMQPWGER